MSLNAAPIGASQDFLTSLNPKASLRTWLKEALADDDLALFFMYTDPPSETESKYGVQLIDPAALPRSANAFHSYAGGRFSPWYSGTEYMGFNDAATLLSAEWLEDFEKINQLNGASLEHDGSSTMCLVPSADVKMHKTGVRYSNSYTRCGTYYSNANKRGAFKWAVLARKSAFNPRLRSWFGDGEQPHSKGTNYPADYLLFDFRGGIPLTVGTYGSEADVWLGEHLDHFRSFPRGGAYVYPSSVEIGRVHIPKVGS
ncbi:MAG: hypothetical protein GY833_22830 [Aestuariibacter sp.]|nr:hypothetical protein [Aestuariibacter sp.]